MVVEHGLAAGMPLAAHCYPPSPLLYSTLKNIRTSRPGYSVGHVFRRILFALSSTTPSVALNAPCHTSTLKNLSKPPFSQANKTLGSIPGIIIYFSSEFSHNETGGTLMQITVCTVDENGNVALIGYARIQKMPYVLFKTSHRVTYGTTTECPRFRQPWRQAIAVVFASLGLYHPLHDSRYRKSHYFVKYHVFTQVRSFFGFLRCCGPRRLGAARLVILDQGEFKITHIGQGAFAVISRVLHRPTNDARVMKRITFDDTGLAKSLAQAEVDALKAMEGSMWFPPLLNHFMHGSEYIVTMPFYRRGDLAGLLQHKGYLGRELAQFYSAQLVLAVQCLHKKGIIHRDIKTDNIFLDEDGHLLLADLGLSENIATFEGGEAMMSKFSVWLEARAKGGDDFPLLWVDGLNPLGTRGIAGTYWYTAPEVFRHERYSFGVDYWSVGVIYHELITGHIPFNHYKLYPESKRPTLDFRIKPGQLKDVALWEQRAIAEMLDPIPGKRPQTVSKIKNSPLFEGVDWEKMARREIHPPLLPCPLREG